MSLEMDKKISVTTSPIMVLHKVELKLCNFLVFYATNSYITTL